MKFTIGIPAYKAAFLKECIDSVLAQTYSDFELVIVNDASPENVDKIIDGYDTTTIRYYKNARNFGAENVVDNWNKCLSYAKGDFFVLMGDDDKLAPQYLEEFEKLIEKFPKCDVYHCRAIIFNDKSDKISLTEPRPEFESVYDAILQRMKGNRHFFISDYAFRTTTLKNNQGFYKLPFAWASDDITAFIAAKRHGIAHTNKPVFMYRHNSQNISATGNVYLKMDAISEEEKWYDSFLVDDPTNNVDTILKANVSAELKRFIQKKKIMTIYSSPNNVLSFLRWFLIKSRFRLSSAEVFYAFLMWIKEKKKKRYEI